MEELCNNAVLDRSQFVQALREVGNSHRGHSMTVSPGIADPLLIAVALDIVLMGFPVGFPIVRISSCPGALRIGLVLQVVRIGETTGDLPQASTLALASWIAAAGLSGNLRGWVECPRAACAPSSSHRFLQRGRCHHGRPSNQCRLP